MVNGLHLYSAFIQSTVQFMPLIHPFTHTFTHQRRFAAMQGTNQLVRSNWGLGVLLRDTLTRPGSDRTGNPSTARRLCLPPEPYHLPECQTYPVFAKTIKGVFNRSASRMATLQLFKFRQEYHSIWLRHRFTHPCCLSWMGRGKAQQRLLPGFVGSHLGWA